MLLSAIPSVLVVVIFEHEVSCGSLDLVSDIVGMELLYLAFISTAFSVLVMVKSIDRA